MLGEVLLGQLCQDGLDRRSLILICGAFVISDQHTQEGCHIIFRKHLWRSYGNDNRE